MDKSEKNNTLAALPEQFTRVCVKHTGDNFFGYPIENRHCGEQAARLIETRAVPWLLSMR